VANGVLLRVFLVIVATQNLECLQIDFKLAFLNSKIPDDYVYYVKPPLGIQGKEGYVWQLKKALYGLRRAPLYWHSTIAPLIKSFGFTPFGADTCLY